MVMVMALALYADGEVQCVHIGDGMVECVSLDTGDSYIVYID